MLPEVCTLWSLWLCNVHPPPS